LVVDAPPQQRQRISGRSFGIFAVDVFAHIGFVPATSVARPTRQKLPMPVAPPAKRTMTLPGDSYKAQSWAFSRKQVYTLGMFTTRSWDIFSSRPSTDFSTAAGYRALSGDAPDGFVVLRRLFARAATMSKTRNNHYVPQWYQEGFFEPGRTSLAYIDTTPDRKVLPDGRVIVQNSASERPNHKLTSPMMITIGCFNVTHQHL
jgi:hypothetical protein